MNTFVFINLTIYQKLSQEAIDNLNRHTIKETDYFKVLK